MPPHTKQITFTIEWPPTAEYESTEPCARCSAPTRVWHTPGHPVQQIRFCPLCWKATSSPLALQRAKGTA